MSGAISFIVHDPAGKILRTGRCPADHLRLQAGYGETAIEGDASDRLHRVEDGRVVVREPDPVVPPSTAELRARAYPPIGDQLDAIWKIIRAGNAPAPAEATAVADAVLAVKTQFTK